MPSDFDTQVQADEIEIDEFDERDEWDWEGDEGDDDEDRNYSHEVDDDFPMYLEYEGPFGLSGYDEY